MHRQDYVAHPYGKRTSCKRNGVNDHPKQVSTFSDVTSYCHDFPLRPLVAVRAPRLSKLAPVPFGVDPSRQNYSTTNAAMLRRWEGLQRVQPLGDPPSQLAFEGEFMQGRSVACEDFNADVCKGRPSTTCKKNDTSIKEYEKFDGSTTSKIAFATVNHPRLEKLFSKRKSQKNTETMPLPSPINAQPICENYVHVLPQERRGLCLPHPDMLKLFEGVMETISEHKGSYQTWGQEFPIQKPKRADGSILHEEDGRPFEGKTSNMMSYVSIHPRTIAQVRHDANALATSNSRFDRQSDHVKEAQNFGEPFQASTVNSSDYFRFWKVSPRHRHGDIHEATHESSEERMEANSEMKFSFVPHKGVKPAQSFKPAVLSATCNSSPSQMSHSTEYTKEFTVKPISANICPALSILQNISV